MEGKSLLSEAKGLILRGKSEEAVSLLKGVEGEEARFYEVSALLSLGRLEEASALFFSHRDAFYELFPKKTIECDFELRFLKREFAKAHADIDYFSNKPYVSQEVEEVLRSLPRLVETNIEALSLPEDAEAKRLSALSSDDDYAVLAALSAFDPKKGGAALRERVRSIVKDGSRSDDLRTYALLFLKAMGDEEPISFEKRGIRHEVVPSFLDDPLTEPSRLKIKELLDEGKDMAVSRLAVSLLEEAVIASYPEPYPGRGMEKEAARALEKAASALLSGSPFSPSSPEERRLNSLLKGGSIA